MAAAQPEELFKVLRVQSLKDFLRQNPNVVAGASLMAGLMAGYIITLDLDKTPQAVISNDHKAEADAKRFRRIKTQVCDEWHYCEKRKDFGDDIKLVCSLIGFLVPLVDWPLRVTAAVVLLAVY